MIKIVVQILSGILCGFLFYNFLINERGKFGRGDTVDKVQAVLMGISGFLVSGIFLWI